MCNARTALDIVATLLVAATPLRSLAIFMSGASHRSDTYLL